MKEKEVEKILKALANRRRLKIVVYLKKHKEASVGEIAEAISLSFRSTSRHLSVLTSVDILEKEQYSSNVLYFLKKGQWSIIHSIIASLS